MVEEGKKDQDILKQIFRENWEAFKAQYPRYDHPYYDWVIRQMLGCGEEGNGYVCYICCYCGKTTKICFSCKSSFCLSCCKVHTDNWVEYVGKALYEGVSYRHVVLTVPEQLRIYFYKDQTLLADLMKTGQQMLMDTIEEWFGKKVAIGCVVVLQTNGRSGEYNPHVHILMTSGGLTKDKKWENLDDISYDLFHHKWQEHLLALIEEKVDATGIAQLIRDLKENYPHGFVAYIDRRKVPKGQKRLYRYLAKYVVSPPIAIRRILEYDGKTVRYWYRDHHSKKRKEEKVDVLEFIGRMVQHILPKGFQRIRYYGLHGTAKRPRVLELLKQALKWGEEVIKRAVQAVKSLCFRERVKESSGQDPLRCSHCGGEMDLYYIWHPRYGTIFNAAKDLFRNDWTFEEKKEDAPCLNSSRETQMLFSFMEW